MPAELEPTAYSVRESILDRITSMEEEALSRLRELGFPVHFRAEAQSVVPELLGKGHLRGSKNEPKRRLAWWMVKALQTAPCLRDAYIERDIDRSVMHAMEIVTAGLSPDFERGHRHLDQVKEAGRKRARRKPAQTRKRNEQMKKDYFVARLHSKMKGPEATKLVADKYGLTVPQVCRIIKPRALERDMRRS